MARHHKKKKHNMRNDVDEMKEIKINVLCDDKLYEKFQESVGAKEGVKVWGMPQPKDDFPFFPIDIIGVPTFALSAAIETYDLLMLKENTIGVVISTTSEMLARTMQKAEARQRQALMVPILVVDEGKQVEAAEPPMLTVEKSRFNSEKELYDFLGRIIDSLQEVDISDLSFIMNEPGRLFFAYAEGESLEIIADKLRDSLKAHGDICAASKAVLATYNIANADAFEPEKLSSWLKGLHIIFGESCGFIDDVRDGSLQNSSAAMWAKL